MHEAERHNKQHFFFQCTKPFPSANYISVHIGKQLSSKQAVWVQVGSVIQNHIGTSVSNFRCVCKMFRRVLKIFRRVRRIAKSDY